jgi:hypothetical protein
MNTTTTTAPAPSTTHAPIALEVFSVDQHKVYPIIFPNEAVALAWCDAHPWSVDGVRSNTYLVGEWTPERGEDEIPGVVQVNQRDHPILTERLYPICEHGMSAQLCAGPMHYPTDAQLMGGAW